MFKLQRVLYEIIGFWGGVWAAIAITSTILGGLLLIVSPALVYPWVLYTLVVYNLANLLYCLVRDEMLPDGEDIGSYISDFIRLWKETK